MGRYKHWTALLVIVLLSGCSEVTKGDKERKSPKGAACTTTSDCEEGLICSAEKVCCDGADCTLETDAGGSDTDVGQPDTPPTDTPPADTPPADTQTNGPPCEANVQCSFQHICNQETHRCEPFESPLCMPCDPEVELPCERGEYVCLPVQEMQHFCMIPCFEADIPENRCPSGYTCEPVWIPENGGGREVAVCMRDCTAPP